MRTTSERPAGLLWWLLVGGMALLLAACGAGSADADAPTAPDPTAKPDYAPLDTGSRWVYRREDGTLEQQAVTGTRTVQGRVATVLATTDVDSGSVEEAFYLKTANALIELPDSSDPVSVQIGDVTLLQLPLQAGQSFVQVDKTLAQGDDLDGDGRPDAMAIRAEVTVLGFDDISVPAGRFSQSAHVRTVVTLNATSSSGGNPLTVTTTVDEWYAPDIGLVRDSIVSEFAGQRFTSARALVAYAVGSRRVDIRSPTLTGSEPAAGAAVRSASQLSLAFDEAMDLASLRNGGFRLLDPAGQTVPVTLLPINSGTGVIVALSAPLGTGRHTVKLGAGAQDLVGNVLPTQEWTFSVDQSGPLVLTALPAAGAVDVAPNTTVRLVFNEALEPTTINTANIAVRGPLLESVPVRVELADARTVLITPLQPLTEALRYTVVLAPTVADVLGNSVGNSVDATFFVTASGRFSAPTLLAGAAGRGVAGGDVNGDGRTDLLTLLDSSGSESAAFNLFQQNAAGGFDTPRRANVVPRLDCGDPGLALLVDMNGDRRADIVATRGSCGVEVFYQGGNGEFERSVLLAGAGFNLLKVVDLNGDRRPDVVASAFGSDTVSVWLQRSDGSWGPQALHPLFNNGNGDLAVGDLNGDGRPDIAVTSGQGDLQRALGITYQQADGSFGAPQYRALSGTFGRSTLTIADLDGDGRADLVTSGAELGTLLWFRQIPGGTLAPPVTLRGAGEAWQLEVADIDGDRRQDIVIGTGGFNSFVVVQLQRADGSFADPVSYRGLEGTSAGYAIVVADLDGDGRPDVALSGPRVLRNVGGSSVSAAGAKAQRWRLRASGLD